MASVALRASVQLGAGKCQFTTVGWHQDLSLLPASLRANIVGYLERNGRGKALRQTALVWWRGLEGAQR